LGNWHASALISTTISGGKNSRSSAPRSFFQTAEAFVEEAFTPLRYDLSGQVQPLADLFVEQALGSKEDNLGLHDITIR
jgi:hypothetical protein